MKSVVTTAKTVEEAVELALRDLNCSLEDVDIQILEEAKTGLFGLIGSKDAVVRVSVKEIEENTLWETSEAETFVEDLAAAKREVQETYHREETQHVFVNGDAVVEEDVTTEELVTVEDAAELEGEEDELVSEQDLDNTVVIESDDAKAPGQVDPDEVDYSDHVEEDEDAFSEEEPEAFAEKTPAPQKTARTETRREGAHLSDDEVIAKTEAHLAEIMKLMHIPCEIEAQIQDENLYVEIKEISDEDMGIVIGRRAETLNALQYLLSVAVNRDLDRFLRVFLDVGGYRQRRKVSIEKLATRNAEKVQRFKRPIALEPMNAYERRIVHYALQDVPNITTVSEGRDPYRKVVIKFER